MNTIHLVYPTLKRVLDSKTNIFNNTNKNTIVLIKQIKNIKQLLNDYCTLPKVINNIICAYTEEITNVKMSIEIVNYGIYDRYEIYFELVFNNETIIISIDCKNDQMFYKIEINRSNIITLYNSNSTIYFCNYLLNTFMKEVYNKDNYINCSTKELGSYIFFMKQNSIICMSQERNYISAIKVKNYRKLTYLIIKLKCIINGIQKYFKTHDIMEYCKKTNSVSRM